MIPSFNELGFLPEGIYESTLDEVKVAFAVNLKRKLLFEGLLKLIQELKSFHCKTIYIDGSFITNKALPSDIDICFDCDEEHWNFAVLMIGNFFKNQEYFKKKYSCNLYPSNLFISEGKAYFKDFLQKDKYTDNRKGIIKINL